MMKLILFTIILSVVTSIVMSYKANAHSQYSPHMHHVDIDEYSEALRRAEDRYYSSVTDEEAREALKELNELRIKSLYERIEKDLRPKPEPDPPWPPILGDKYKCDLIFD